MREPIFLRDETFWNEQVLKNTDPYSKMVITAAREVMMTLDDRDDFKAACDKIFNHSLSSFQAGLVAQIVTRCHDKGDDFKKNWNRFWEVSECCDPVNPALLSITGNETPQ